MATTPEPEAPTFDDAITAVAPALDAVSACVVVADRALTLRWRNRAAATLLRAIEPELRASFGVALDEMVGGSVHRFHRDPERIERLLADDAGTTFPHQARFDIGAATLRASIDRLVTGGHHLGYLVTLEDSSALQTQQAVTESLGIQLTTAASAIEELNLSITEISVNASRAAQLATTAALETGRISAEAADLDARRVEIDDAIGSIDAIAAQTNLLACLLYTSDAADDDYTV